MARGVAELLIETLKVVASVRLVVIMQKKEVIGFNLERRVSSDLICGMRFLVEKVNVFLFLRYIQLI